MRALVTALVAFSLVLPRAAQGEADETRRSRRIALVTVAGSQAPRERADELARRVLRGVRERRRFIGPAQLRRAMRDDGAGEDLTEARHQAAAGRRELRSFVDLPRAAALLEEAREAYCSLLPLLSSIDEPLQLAEELATVYLAMGDEDQVRAALIAAARLNPVLDLDPDENPPTLVRLAEQARQQASGNALTSEQVVDLGSYVDVGGLLLIQPRPDDARAVAELYDGETGERTNSWEIENDDVSELVAYLRDRSRPEPRPASAPVEETPPPPEETPDPEPEVTPMDYPPLPEPGPEPGHWYTSWWLWTLVSVVVVSGVATAIGVSLTLREEPGYMDLEVTRSW